MSGRLYVPSVGKAPDGGLVPLGYRLAEFKGGTAPTPIGEPTDLRSAYDLADQAAGEDWADHR